MCAGARPDRMVRFETVGVFAFNAESDALQAGFFPRLIIKYLCLETALLSPFQIHTQEHLGPVLRFSAASARMNGANSIALIIFSRQQHLSFRLVQVMFETLDERAQLFHRFFIFFGKLEKDPGVFYLRLEMLLPFNLSFEPAAFLQ